MTCKKVFFIALDELEKYMSWYYDKIGFTQDQISEETIKEYNALWTMWEEAEHRPKGKWIGIGHDGYADGNPVYDEWECSNCGHEIKTEDTPPYCEMCGADMRGGE